MTLPSLPPNSLLARVSRAHEASSTPSIAPERLGDDRTPFAPRAYTPNGAGDIEALRTELRTELRAVRAAASRAPADTSDLLDEIAALREELRTLLRYERPETKARALAGELGLEGVAATIVARGLANEAGAGNEGALRSLLSDMLEVDSNPLFARASVSIAFVGPSGIGKTTTAAKVAATAKQQGRSVALVGCDTYRVSALEQLERYADLLEVEFHVAANDAALSRVLAQTRAEVVLIDRGAERRGATFRTPSLGSIAREERTVLCAPANTRAHDAEQIAKLYRSANPTDLCITKIDETKKPAGIVHMALATKLPISLATSGARVPEDLTTPSISWLLECLLRSTSKGRRRKA